MKKDFLILANGQGIYIPLTRKPRTTQINGVLVALVLVGLLVALVVINKRPQPQPKEQPAPTVPDLYLINHAQKYTLNIEGFGKKVVEVADGLNIPPNWLMAIMYSESKLNASATNHKGSGATGLIQFMPETLKEFGITTAQLQNLNHVEQLDFVGEYLERVKKVRKTDFETLTDLYLGVLYPKALEHKTDPDFILYSKPNPQYLNNRGLDFNQDGKVTIRDIDKRMKKLYSTAYKTKLQPPQKGGKN